jgi:cyclic 2,3-diphosphoglycerate synthetase
VLIDGEHYPLTNYDSILKLKRSFKGNINGIIFLGGTEKLVVDNLESFYGYKVFDIKDIDRDFLAALEIFKPDFVYDLSDEPVVNHSIRMKIASFCFARQCSYFGPDFYFEYEPKDIIISKPSLLVIGTGKRTGKTAVSSHIARLLSQNSDVCIIAMGRGGPERPQVIRGSQTEITPEYLLNISRSGLHASSDYIEDALFSGVTTVGCRRCGGGFGGKFFMSNIVQGVKIAKSLNPEIIIVEGSGSSIPPVKTDFVICVLGAGQDWDSLIGYLGLYRILLSEMVFLTMCEEPIADSKKVEFLEREIKKINPGVKVVKSIFRPEPLYNIEKKRIFLVLTAKSLIEHKIKDYLEDKYSCVVVKVSFNLANREKLKAELHSFYDYDVLLTELKAASVDLVTEFAIKNYKEINYLNNIPLITEGKEHIQKLITDLEKRKNARK